jgi:hypothetical protein
VNESLFLDFRGGVMLVDFPLTASEFIGANPVSQVELSATGATTPSSIPISPTW